LKCPLKKASRQKNRDASENILNLLETTDYKPAP
jgi:hypothetical protein